MRTPLPHVCGLHLGAEQLQAIEAACGVNFKAHAKDYMYPMRKGDGNKPSL